MNFADTVDHKISIKEIENIDKSCLKAKKAKKKKKKKAKEHEVDTLGTVPIDSEKRLL